MALSANPLPKACVGLLLAALLCSTAAVSAELRFIPLLSDKEEYNNNVLFESRDAQTLHDAITTVSPGLRLTDRTERLTGSLQSLFHVIRYYNNDEFNATDQDHAGKVSYRFTERWQGSADAGYVRDSRVDRDIETTGLTLGTSTRRRLHGGGSTDYTISEKAGVGLSYAYDKDNFDSPTLVDSTTQNASVRATYDLGSYLPGTVAQAQTTSTLYDYPDTRVVDVACTVGASTRLNEKLSLSAYLGRSRTRTRSETTIFIFEFDETTITRGNVGQVMLSYAGEKTSVDLSLNQGVRSISGSASTVRRTSAHLGIRRKFTADLEGSVTGEYYLNKAKQGQLSSENIDQQTWWVQPRLIWRFTNDFFLESSYRFIRLSDSDTDRKYLQSTAFLRLVWQYPMPR